MFTRARPEAIAKGDALLFRHNLRLLSRHPVILGGFNSLPFAQFACAKHHLAFLQGSVGVMLFDNLIFDESGPFSFINITGRKDGGIIQCGGIRLDQN